MESGTIQFLVSALIVLHSLNQKQCLATDLKSPSQSQGKLLQPTVMVAVLARNKASILPWFFGHLEHLNYPKERITIWIRSDHNEDNTASMLRNWVKAVQSEYRQVDLKIDAKTARYGDSKGPMDWSSQRYQQVRSLREEALQTARKKLVDYLFMLDADVILENPETLNLLIDTKQPIIAPMLNASLNEEQAPYVYSNFWCHSWETTDCYERMTWYSDIVDRRTLGIFGVPLVHTALLIDMRLKGTEHFSYVKNSSRLAFRHNDIITFAENAMGAGSRAYIMNTEYFGIVMVPMEVYNSIEDEADHFDFARMDADVDRPGLVQTPHITVTDKKITKMGLNKIYVINLLRRPERRKRINKALKILGMEAKIVEAVDGRLLNSTYLASLKIQMMTDFVEPNQGRTSLTMGEVGIFLSHYFIWKDIVENNYEKTIVFEDDVRFEPYFTKNLKAVMSQAENLVKDWDLIFLSRKRLDFDTEESFVEGSDCLVWPTYSYWAIAYVLSRQGAQKLLDQKPLQKMIPVDEYIPIMYDQHPEEGWKIQFSPRNFVALSVEPLIARPTHFTGEPNYISDTEDAPLMYEDDKAPENIPPIQKDRHRLEL